MKRYHARLVPLLDEREQVHAGMSKIDMHQIGAMPLQQRIKRLILASIDNGRAPLHEFQPAVYQQICAPLRYNFYSGKRKSFRILDLFCDNEGIDAPQRFHLPVNMQHLRLQKAGAIARYDPPAHRTRPVSLGILGLSTVNWGVDSLVGSHSRCQRLL